jgi:hypothetical protein
MAARQESRHNMACTAPMCSETGGTGPEATGCREPLLRAGLIRHNLNTARIMKGLYSNSAHTSALSFGPLSPWPIAYCLSQPHERIHADSQWKRWREKVAWSHRMTDRQAIGSVILRTASKQEDPKKGWVEMKNGGLMACPRAGGDRPLRGPLELLNYLK